MISMWFFFWLYHHLQVSVNDWYAVPFVITAFFSFYCELVGYIDIAFWLQGRMK